MKIYIIYYYSGVLIPFKTGRYPKSQTSRKENFMINSKLVTLFMSALIIGGTLQSCTIAKIGGRGAVPLVLNQPTEKMKLFEHVTVKKNTFFDFTNSYEISEVIAEKVVEKQPDAVINTSITIEQGFDNFLINLFTLGLANSKKIVVDADFVRSTK